MLIFAVPSRNDMTRVAGPTISGSGRGKRSTPKSLLNFCGDVAGELEVLLLVLAHRHVRRLVEQHVGGHAAPDR